MINVSRKIKVALIIILVVSVIGAIGLGYRVISYLDSFSDVSQCAVSSSLSQNSEYKAVEYISLDCLLFRPGVTLLPP